ncbi:MAG: hypothetical protein M1839_005937 [Geoglossum umbratile]|nr:MAG: hypothetical protein M1839_005937 [Geoglossum umbratile]
MDGYEKLSWFMGTKPGLAILRRFSALGMSNLLYMQAQLVYLKLEWAAMVKKDIESGRNVRHSVHDMIITGDRMWRKVLEIRELVKQYNDAALQQYQIYKLEIPNEKDFRTLRDFLTSLLEGVDNFFHGETMGRGKYRGHDGSIEPS